MVPYIFQQKHPFPYPPDNATVFEEWYSKQPHPITERKYLPIFWTAYQIRANYGKNISMMNKLQRFIDGLPRTEKYYTICQYDNGCLFDFKDLDICIYGMSEKYHYPLPLICTPHQTPRLNGNVRQYQACFIGSINHPIRQELMKFELQKGWYMSKRVHNMPAFCNIMNQSVFALCPRGYGPTSFRIMEALQYGAIPVYISDTFVIPHNKDFSEYGILVAPDQMKDLPAILKAADVKKLQDAGEYIYRNYYTYSANLELIHKDLLTKT